MSLAAAAADSPSTVSPTGGSAFPSHSDSVSPSFDTPFDYACSDPDDSTSSLSSGSVLSPGATSATYPPSDSGTALDAAVAAENQDDIFAEDEKRLVVLVPLGDEGAELLSSVEERVRRVWQCEIRRGLDALDTDPDSEKRMLDVLVLVSRDLRQPEQESRLYFFLYDLAQRSTVSITILTTKQHADQARQWQKALRARFIICNRKTPIHSFQLKLAATFSPFPPISSFFIIDLCIKPSSDNRILLSP